MNVCRRLVVLSNTTRVSVGVLVCQRLAYKANRRIPFPQNGKSRPEPSFLRAVIFGLVLLSMAVQVRAQATYGNGYAYRRALVLSHANVPNTDQTDFPVLISGVYPYLATVSNGGLVQNANGYDIVFAPDPEGASPLDFEIDTYSPTTGSVNFWVRIPTLSHTVDTVIYLFYGNPNVTTSQQNVSGVWRNNYLSVYHLGNGSGVGLADSGSAGYTLSGSASAVSGKIGGGAGFSGNAGTYLYNDSLPAYPSGASAVTLEGWIQLQSSSGGFDMLGYGANSANGSRAALGWGGGTASLEFENMSVSGSLPFDTNWHHLVGVYGGGALSTSADQLYLDGIPLSTNISAGTPAIINTEFKIGGIPTVNFCCAMTGSVDEVRVSSSTRSADWVATEFKNQSSPSSFYAVEAQATPNSAPTIQSLSPTSGQTGTVVTIQGFGFQTSQGSSTVAFNGTFAAPTSWNDAAIVVPVPVGATSGNVTVTVGGVVSNGVGFDVYAGYNGQGYANGYAYRRAIVLGHVNVPNTDQTDFPVLISGVYPYLATVSNGGLVQNANGYDIVFASDPEGASPLDCEIDTFDPVTGTVNFWVRIPTLSHTVDNVIYLFYGNSNVTQSQQNVAGVWRNNYLSVYHLGNGSAVGLSDSGSAGYTLSGSATSIPGKIGGGVGFNGNPSVYLYNDSLPAYPIGASPVTLESWVQFASSTGGFDILGYGANSANGSRAALGWDGSNGVLEFENMNVNGPVPFNTNWHHLVGVYSGGTLSTATGQLYLDGILVSNTGSGGTPWILNNEFKIGGIPTVNFCCAMTGSVDEVRVSSVTRSSDWIAAEYANQSSPSTFFAVESEATANSSPTVQFLSPVAGTPGSTVTIEGYGFQSTQGSSIVTFNGMTAAPVSWSDASIVVSVPTLATTGYVIVSVGGVASNGATFAVLPFPSITNLNPSSGGVGAAVIITGNNFGSQLGSSTVTFNGVLAAPTSWSPTSITVPVPMEATTGTVVVTVGGGQSNGVPFGLPISGISPQVGMVGTFVTISGSGFGSSQGTNTVTLNGISASVVNWTDTSIGVIVPTGATSGPFLVTVNSQAETSPPFSVTNLPTGWADVDIGAVSQPGAATFSNGAFTVSSGAGGSEGGLGGTADALHFAYQPLTGNGSIVARLTSNPSGQAGVMIRESLNPASTDISAIVSGNIFLLDRAATGADANSQPPYGVGGYSLPVWFQLVRSGNLFTGSISPDGVNWTEVGSTTVSMAQTVYVGLAVTGFSSPDTASFDSVSINSTTTPSPVINILSPSTAAVGTQVGVIGNNFGASQGGSLVLLNGSPITTDSWSDAGILFTVPSGATSGPLLVSVSPSMNNSNPVRLEVTNQPLPTSWLNQDVGAVGSQIGTSTSSGGTFSITGGGVGIPIPATADAFQFAYQTLTGDGSITARLTSVQGGEAGIMIRETLNADAANVAVLSSGNVILEDRPSTGADTAYQPPYGLGGYSFPVWFELVRAGNTFTGYVSSDDQSWTSLGSTTVSMAETVYIGLAVSGGNTLATSTFDNVSINSSAAPAPVITGLSATTAAIGSQIQITGSGFGSAQSSGLVELNGAAMTINLWSNTSIVFTVATGASTGPLAVLVAPSLNASNAVHFEVTSQFLPAPWLNQDVGSVVQTGSSTYATGVFTLTGGGGGIQGTADSMQFAYQTLSGDGSIIARVTGLQGGQAAVMIRETLNPAAADADVFWAGNTFLQYRQTTGAAAQAVSYYGLGGYSTPVWLELVRAGSTFTGYVSSDGQSWTSLGNTTVTMAQTVYVGLATSSNGSTATASFDNVSITAGSTPSVSNLYPIVGTIGTPVTINGSNFGATQGTSTVTFNGAVATSITSWSNTQIVATVPNSVPVGTGPVTVTVNSISSPNTASSQFTVIEPIITSLLPPAGPVGGTIVINGSGFGASQNGVVSINGVVANVAYTCLQNPWYACWTDTQIQAVVSAGTTTGPLTVSNDGIVSSPVSFTITTPPVVTSISPAIGSYGSVVTINGTGFGPTQSDNTASFMWAGAGVVSWSDTQIQVTVPVGAVSGPIDVNVAGLDGLSSDFTVEEAATLTDSFGRESFYMSEITGSSWNVVQVQGSGCSSCSPRGNVQNTYDSSGDLLSTTDGNGNTWNYTWDNNGNMLSRSIQLGSGQSATTSYTYNSFGEVLTMTDALGNVTTNTYDGSGNLLSVTTPQPTATTPASVTQFGYDTKGELTQITDPLRHPTTLTYTATGMIASITDAQNNTTSYGYDQRGNRTTVVDPVNGSAHPTTFAYDIMNRLTGITYPDGTSVSFGYDIRGRRISATDQNNKTTTYAYDDADHLISVTDAANNLTQYNYDTENNLISITDGDNHTTYFAYDAMGRVIQTTFPSTLTETYTYDQLYNLTSKTDRKNQTIQYVYDAMNRLTSKTYPDSTAVDYLYDLVGKIQQVSDPTGTYAFAYDNMGRLIGTSTQYSFLPGHNFQNSYGYDAASNRTSLTAPDGSTNSYQYDTLNRIATLTNSLTGQFGFAYDALSRRTQLTRPNGVNTNYNYDSVSHLLSVLHQAGSTTLDGASYGYDYAGNRTSKTNYLNGTTSNYGYDAIYELLQVTQGGSTTESYSYDAVGNRMSSSGVPTYSYNSSNELTSNSSGSYTYDANGNTLSDPSGKSYSWDFENRLLSAVVPGTGTVSFKYDPFGRRIQKSGPLGTMNYLYDGVNLLEDADGSGNLLVKYTQGIGIDDPMTILRAGTASYYQADALGAVTSLSNPAGALANTYTYDSFGKLTASTGTLTNAYGFTGRELDPETGIYYYRFRYYDQNVGRFISEDPIAWRGGIDFYRYADGNPVSETDPLGLDTKVCYYSDAAAGFGHVGFGLPGETGTEGFGPVNWWQGLDGPGQLGPDKEKKSQCKTIPAPKDKDQCMLQCRLRRQSNPGKYKLFTRQCTSFVRDCLRECGEPSGNYNGPNPWPFFNDLP